MSETQAQTATGTFVTIDGALYELHCETQAAIGNFVAPDGALYELHGESYQPLHHGAIVEEIKFAVVSTSAGKRGISYGKGGMFKGRQIRAVEPRHPTPSPPCAA